MDKDSIEGLDDKLRPLDSRNQESDGEAVANETNVSGPDDNADGPPPLPTDDQDSSDEQASEKKADSVGAFQINTGQDTYAADQGVPEHGDSPVSKVDVKASDSQSDEQASHEQAKPENASAPQAIPSSSGTEMQDRIESQRAKEEQDQHFKVILDRVLWGSCGVALVAIIWVMIARTSGCNSRPVTIAENSEADAEIDSQKIKPRKKLDRTLVSPIEKSEKKKLKNKTNKQNSAGKKTAAKNPSANKAAKFETIKQTIGFFDFNEPVNSTDLLDALGPLRLTKIKWSKAGGGHIQLSKNSHVYIDSEKAFDNIKALTLLARFKSNKKNGKQVLMSIENQLTLLLENNRLGIQIGVGKKNSLFGDKLADNQWHQVALTIGKSGNRLWLDGKFINESTQKLPDFRAVKNDSEIGSANGKDRFEGSLDNLGFYWVELNEAQIKSQFAR